jgi:hypothetical protein
MGPGHEGVAQDQGGLAVFEHEGAVGQGGPAQFVQAAAVGPGHDPLGVQRGVDLLGAR